MLKNVKVLLINPSTIDEVVNKEFTPPLSLLYLGAALLKNGFETQILDINLYKPWKQDNESGYVKEIILNRIREYNPGLIGFGCLFSGQFPFVVRHSENIRNNFDVPIVVGGMHSTIFYQDILMKCPYIDYVVIGEGEETIVNLANSIQKEVPLSPAVPGIAYRKKGKVIVNSKQGYIKKLDTIPFPAHELINLEDYYHNTDNWHNPKGLKFKMTMPILASRSCPMKCNFCSMRLVMGDIIRYRTPKNIVDELEMLFNKYSLNRFSFWDDNLNINKKQIIAINDEIIKRNLNIQYETPNGLGIRTLDEEIIDSMVEGGWVRGAIAIESGSDYIRNKVIGKKLTKEKIIEVLKLLRKHKSLHIRAFFIIGFPEETSETIMESYEMIKKINVDEVYVTNCTPFPGTALFEQVKRDNLFVDSIKQQDLFKKPVFSNPNPSNKNFYIKPYKMEISELELFRMKIDKLIEKKYQNSYF